MKKSLLLLAAALFLEGCSRSGPKPLAVEEIPAALSNSFKSARLLTRQNAESVAKQVEARQYAPATIQLQALGSQELNKEQQEVTSASLVTLNVILQEQAASLQPQDAAETVPASAPKQPVDNEEAAAAAAVIDNYIRTK